MGIPVPISMSGILIPDVDSNSVADNSASLMVLINITFNLQVSLRQCA